MVVLVGVCELVGVYVLVGVGPPMFILPISLSLTGIALPYFLINSGIDIGTKIFI